MVATIDAVTIFVSSVELIQSILLLLVGLSLGAFIAMVLVQFKVIEGFTIIDTKYKWDTLKRLTL